MSQIIYPKYVFFITIYAILLFVMGISYAKVIDKVFPDFDKLEKKPGKLVVLFETLVQVSLTVVGSYIFRELLEYLFRNLLGLDKYIIGNPDRFAIIIVAPTMFFTQKNLQHKINYLWNLKRI
jgi:hypothetical protein